VNNTHIKASPVLWVMIGMVVAGGAVWSAYLGSQFEWGVELVASTSLLAVLVMVAGLFPIPVAPRVKAGMTTAPLFAAALVLPPGGVVIAAVVGGLTYQAALRFRSPHVQVPWYQIIFNVGETALSTGVAAFLFDRMADDGLISAAIILAAAAMYLINSSLISLIAATQLRESPLKFWWMGTRESGLAELSLYALGYLGALAYESNALAITAVLLPVFIVYHAFSSITRTNTQLERALDDIRTLQGQLLQNAKLATLGTLTLDLAHQLKNPLFIVTGRLENLMWKIPKGDPIALQLDEALQAAWRTNQLIEAFLNEAQQRWAPMNIVALLNEAVSSAMTKTNKPITIERNYLAADVQTEGMPTLMREALLNLVVNAVEAVPSGGTVAASIERNAQGAVVIAISDNGLGIPAQQMEHLFEPFWTSKEDGTGIGLFSAKHIVELHQGRLNVASTEGVGTRVEIILPITKLQGEHIDIPIPECS
jgi:signal transduction histidine kinase